MRRKEHISTKCIMKEGNRTTYLWGRTANFPDEGF